MKCDNCQSDNIEPTFRMWLILTVLSGLIVLVPFIGWVLSPIMLFLALLIYMAERKKRAIHCNDCSNVFLVTHEEFYDHQSSHR